MRRITWLASHPKSGNTWLRVFLANLQRDDAGPANINELDTVAAHDRDLFDRLVGYETGDLTHDEVDLLRPEVYLYQATHAEQPFFCKVHDAYTYLPDGQPLFPLGATAGVIYLIRNPLDVCVSYAHHLGKSTEVVIAMMADPHHAMAAWRDRPRAGLLRQRLLRWSDHVLSWVDAPGLRIHVCRYEDLKSRPVEAFTAAAAFVGMTQDRAKIARALAFSSFEELQRQEREQGFQEAVGRERAFFRKGKVGGWREVLTAPQVARIIADHRQVMLRFGYLTETGDPVV